MPSAPQNGKKVAKPEGGTVSETKGKTDYDEFFPEEEFSVTTYIPPMMIVLAGSLLVVLALSGAVIFGIRRRGRRKRYEREMEQVSRKFFCDKKFPVYACITFFLNSFSQQIKSNEELPYVQSVDLPEATSPDQSGKLSRIYFLQLKILC